ncbi:MAG: RsmB/NOP family class I SAM-dependent RNA methyltransferase [Candidatus Kerfeldbacteria bacterium]|nr:RsmB/NOP family class I SAM-dependent RNA methyltransferase [Candidatus Kerfeldbacteria bacterium]
MMSFIEYYQQWFTAPGELAAVLQALQQSRQPILRFTTQHQAALEQLWHSHQLPFQILPWYAQAALWPNTVPAEIILPGYDEHLFYAMNAASLLPVLALQPQPGETVFDACAAPGGKALMIAEQLNHTGAFIANDSSPARRQRLRQVLNDYGFSDTTVSGKKAEIIYQRQPNYFDKILLDAPCSSERHVYNSPNHLQLWSPNRVRSLQQRQLALLGGLLLALKPGGRLVYSTCALTPEENELVVQKFLDKRGAMITLRSFADCVSLPVPGEPSQLLPATWRIFPHRHQLDPMFIAVFEKK